MRSVKILIPAFLICCFGVCLPAVQAVQEEKPDPATQADQAETEKPADKPADAEKPAEDTHAKWEKLSARKKEIAVKLAELTKQFQAAPVEEKRQIRDQYQKLIDEFLLDISPEMTKLAGQVYEADPENIEAAEFLMQDAWNRNDYPQVVKVADKMIADGHLTNTTLNLGGSAHYAEHNFEKAVELLTQAKTRNALSRETGSQYFDAAKEYIDLWKAEQAIREKEANAPEGELLPRVELQTNKGKILVELFENEAPNTVANFISLVENKTYDGIKFHRVLPNFMIQGGDPNSKDDDPANDGQGGPGYTIKCECYKDDARMHFAGSLSMAHAGKDSGGSQFFITHLPTRHLNPNNDTPYNHTVFGRVVEGLDVVRSIEKDDVIEKATVIRKRDHEYKPETTPEVEK